MKSFIPIAVLLLCGCALGEKGENYKRAASMAVNPQCVKIMYGRENGNATFGELRCTGKMCETVKACD